jgi:UDPglucose 6-dehydrogenase
VIVEFDGAPTGIEVAVKISVIGTGYVGLVAGACLAETGNTVVCADVDQAKIDGLNRNVMPIYEPGLDQLVSRNQQAGRLLFTTEIGAAVASADVIFIAVGTPPGEDGSADLRYVLAVADTIGRNLQRDNVVIVNKSTVPVGTARKVVDHITQALAEPRAFYVVSNPEFLKEGAAIEDFMKPDRVVIGANHPHAREVMRELYEPFVRTGNPIIFMDRASAELTKYAANAMLATRISFMNDIANLCDRVGANVDLVREGIGTDERIGPAFLFPGPGYGGSCFPKDVKALVKTGREQGMVLRVLEAVEAVNHDQKQRLMEKLRLALGQDLSGVRIAVWGLTFKPNTNDMRESPAIPLLEALRLSGARAVCHDPEGMSEARKWLPWIELAPGNYEALEGADALVVVTEWNEYRHPDFQRIKNTLRRPVIIDGRNLYSLSRMKEFGFVYHSIGRPEVL